MIIEQLFYWTGFIVLELGLLFCIIFLLWHIGMWIEQHLKWYFFALWVVLWNYWKQKGKEPAKTIYWNNKQFMIVEVTHARCRICKCHIPTGTTICDCVSCNETAKQEGSK